VSEAQPMSLRERTRQIVRSELTEIAQDLFLENGYESTTIEQIAAAAGMSKRTLFRYFASNEDLVIGKYELVGDRMAAALRERPSSEPLWTALLHVFDLTLVYFEDGPARERNDVMEQIVRSSPGLYAAYLEKLARVQDTVAQAARERLTDQPPPPDPVLKARTIVGAAFACLAAAQQQSHESNGQQAFADLLDAAMGTLRVVI
jgi:AcrR family transcriptional regulator